MGTHLINFEALKTTYLVNLIRFEGYNDNYYDLKTRFQNIHF